MSKENKEFVRRLRKMSVHVSALRRLARTTAQKQRLDAIEGELNTLKEDHEYQVANP